ncbi:MAG: thioredoxin domain-containing protein [Candidatus Magasanikbacteria bacterium]|jgi:protein-disulfide isomerase|nr:thioredoxin domain-containing protein [Candidatus Magasanikbacteria bacterium]MBT4315021.1 thioredoxin domain-containing protein [Candidatus Magasanikbacteria bacterium]MBT4546800.1 thioredoxin domain-containing protein [Candidatus Magasanikbacteria bacterium]MBT6818965.1 thioredoxin domain-containing protein [Candidatus Magasanikbacteria bacterium]
MKEELSKLSPKLTFVGGMMGGLLVMFAIGFFILLGIVMNGSSVDAENYEADLAGNAKPTQVAKAPTAPPSVGNTKIALAEITSDDHIRGNVDAPITIVEFSDSECPFCKRFHDSMLEVMDGYGDQVRWVYKHAPLDSLHRKARKEAEAMECASELGGNDGFWKYADRLYEITPSNDGLNIAELPKIAEYVGLNVGKFENCLESGKYADKVQSDLNEATAAGLRGTPYSVIITEDGQTIPVSGAYPFGQLKAMIDPLLK